MDGDSEQRRRRIGGRPRLGRSRPAGTAGRAGRRRGRAGGTRFGGARLVRTRDGRVPDAPEGLADFHDRHITWQSIRVTPRQRWALLVLASRRGRSVTELLRPLIVDMLREAELLTPAQCEPPAKPRGVDPRLQRRMFEGE